MIYIFSSFDLTKPSLPIWSLILWFKSQQSRVMEKMSYHETGWSFIIMFHRLASSSSGSCFSQPSPLSSSVSLPVSSSFSPRAAVDRVSLVFAAHLKAEWTRVDSWLLCVFVYSVEDTGRLEESQDELTGELVTSSLSTINLLFQQVGITKGLDETMVHTWIS